MIHRLIILFILLSAPLFAQKKPLNHSVYDNWQSLGQKTLSNNGLWTAFGINVQEGDSMLFLQENINFNKKIKIDRGSKLSFSNDSKYAALFIKPHFIDIRQAKIKKKKPNEYPKDSLAIVDLSNLKITKIPLIKEFSFPKEGNSIFAYLIETKQDSVSKKSKTTSKNTKESNNLVVKNLLTGNERVFKNVENFQFNKNGKSILISVNENKDDNSIRPGVFLLNTEKWTLKTLVNKKGNFSHFTFDDEGEHLAFLGETDSAKKEIKDYKIYYNSISLDTAQILVDNELTGMPKNWSVSKNNRISFSKDGSKLFFNIAPTPLPKDTTLIEMDHAKLDIWSYKDDYLQTVQLYNLKRDLSKSYLSCIDIYNADPKIIPLTDITVPDASIINEGNSDYVLAVSDYGNRIPAQWNGKTLKDYYLVNIKNGQRKKIIEKLNGYASASPSGNYIIYFNQEIGHWFIYQIATGKVTNLTANLSVSFFDEENDVPDKPSSYGIAGWTADDKQVLINDRYDVWAFATDGKFTVNNITSGYGRANKITFRVVKLNHEDRFFSKNEKLWFSALNNINKETGFFRRGINEHKNPELIMMDKYMFKSLSKAQNTDNYLFEKESFEKSPELYFTKDFKSNHLIANTNPQQSDYNWGTAELIHWTTPKGHTSTGILYKPEDFDPNKKYPMIVYFYEKLSDGLYQYIAPAPTPSRLNISYFVSNGYLVFAPDISYEIGHPGKSAEDFINSGVEYLKKNSWVNGNKIGIQGQSWGGYQVAHLITATNMYAAAWAGAPVVNMTSAYGGIRWASGMNRQFQYEKTQSRIGANLWEKPELYIENSPLFNLPKVNTPVVIMHNDADGAVPWYQGIEMFTGLRRLGKPVWLLNYNNDAHNLMLRQNREDIQIREQQFFDYYLKDKKAPSWMVNGIPATEKGKNWGFDLVDGKP